MTEKRPTQVLEEEHRSIQQVVGTMAALAEALEKGRNAQVEILQSIVAFMRTFADQCHHGKCSPAPVSSPGSGCS
jgi:hemerythrin-like domain-containing protein